METLRGSPFPAVMPFQFLTEEGLGSRPPLLTAFYSPSSMCNGAIPGWVLFHIPFLTITHRNKVLPPLPPHVRGPSPIPHALLCLPSLPLLGRIIPRQQRWQPHTPLGSEQPCGVPRGRTSRLTAGRAGAAGSLAKSPHWQHLSLHQPPSLFTGASPRGLKPQGEWEKEKVANLDRPNRTTCRRVSVCNACAGGRPHA